MGISPVTHPGDLARKSMDNYITRLKAENKAKIRARRGTKHAVGMTRTDAAMRHAAARKRHKAAQRARRRNR